MALVIRADGTSGTEATERLVRAAASRRAPAGTSWQERVEDRAPWVAAMLLVVGYAVSLLIWSGVRAEPIRIASDFSVFALLYIAAQATERILEPLAAFLLTTDAPRERLEASMAAAINAPEDASRWEEAADARERLDRRRRARSYLLWSSATVVGMVASSSLGIYLIAAIAADRYAAIPVDILITGLVVGGGTKPLHDLITRIESAKQRAQDPLGG